MHKRLEPSRLEPSVMPPHRRLAAALAAARRRLERGNGNAAQPVWNATLTRWLVLALLAMLFAGFADEAIIRSAQESRTLAVRFMAYITNIGKSQWYLVPAALVFLAVGLYDWSRGGLRAKARLALMFGQAAYVFSAVALSGIFVNILKVIFGRARPGQFDQLGAWSFDPLTFGYDYASFPSGHSTTVGAVVGVLIVWFPRWSIVIVEFGLFFAATRIAALAHYPSDVIAGFTTGIFFAIVIARWFAARGVVFRFMPGKTLPAVGPVLPRKSGS